MTDRQAQPIAAPGSPTDLFLAFTRLALQGFGGVLAVAQRELVDRLGWMTQSEFVECLSVGQVLPGPNIVNMALMIGDRHFGWRGALAAVAGLLAAPLLIVLLLAGLYGRFGHWPPLAGALRGMGAVAAGLVVATALKMLPTLRTNPMGRFTCLLLLGVTTLAVGVWRWPLAAVVLGLGGLAMAFAAWRLRGVDPAGPNGTR